MLETKTFTKNAKISNFSPRKTSFFFSIFLRFHAVNIKEFHSTTIYLCSKCTAKNLCKKTLSQLLMQQHNLQTKKKMKKRNFYFILLQNNATRKNDDKNKTKRMKRRLWLKVQIAKESEHKMQKSNLESTNSNTCLKTIKQIFFSFVFSIKNQLTTQAKDNIP